MTTAQLIQVAVFLAAAAIAAPFGRFLRIGAVLGYLAAGVVIGPYVLGPLYALDNVEKVLQFGELGVVLLLFVIGLELRPVRLWALRSAIFGLGTAQLVATSFVLATIGVVLGLATGKALFIGLALSLSSTAFALQVLEEKGELTTRHGRLAFSVLLFQDLAAIPLIALVPLFSLGGNEPSMDLKSAGIAILTIVGVIVVGRFLLSRLYRFVAATGVREAMTASALLTVVGVALIMEAVGLSAALGSFIAGALLADSEYRHQIEADIAPFEGLLLAVFFIAVGMSMDLSVLLARPAALAAIVAGLVVMKAVILYGLGRWWGIGNSSARRLGLVLSQGGEFAFVLFSVGVFEGVIGRDLASLLTLAVTLSMAMTPLLLLIDDRVSRALQPAPPEYEMPPEGEDGHVIVAGFGRFGQIVARVLRARHIPFTALDSNVAQVDFVRRFGAEIYYGDAGRLDILRGAGAHKARAFVLAIDSVDHSLRVAEMVREHFPDLPIYARARDRTHVHKLMDLGVTIIERETFLAALELTKDLLRGLGLKETEVRRLTETFQRLDEKRLYDDYQYYTDLEKVRANALTQAKELEEVFAQDIAELPGEGAATAERRDDRGSSD
jgi:monovalent cation:proton antiporter-2 (CPA2) family protein